MTRKYWIGIFAGMLGIFCVGMLVARGVKFGKRFVDDNLPSPMKLMSSTGFRVDGDRMGDIQRLQFMRTSPGKFDSAVVTVQIDDSADLARISSCILRVTSARPFDSDTRFTCESRSDSTSLDLVPFGHVEVLPSGKHVTYYVARSVIDEMHQKAYKGKGSADSGDVDINMLNDDLKITVNGREIFTAGDGGLIVRDGNGNAIVQFRGDSNGGSIKVTDSHGKSVVDLKGTDKHKP